MKLRNQILLSIASGIMVCISFPTLIAGVRFPELGPLAWVALVPLILAIRDKSPRRAFTLTFIAAAVWYSGSIFWVYRAMHTFGHLPSATSLLVLILLVFVVAAYISLAPMCARFIETRWRGEMIVWLPVSWTGVEILRNYIPCNGFPWSNVAMSQWRFLSVIQIADIAGIYGVTFLIVWINVFIVEIIRRLGGASVSRFIPKVVVTSCIIVAVIGYGTYRLHVVPQSFKEENSLSVGMIQGNIPQDEKWAKESAPRNLKIYMEGAKRLQSAPVELIIWPESAFPWPVKADDTEIEPRALGVTDGAPGWNPYTLLGAITDERSGDYYNSAILFDASGKVAGRYHKVHLVPFGEYVPYKKLLFFAKKLTQPVGNFMAGESSEPLIVHDAKIGVLICYEDVFPEVARNEVLSGANFLANLTNDAWYGVSSAAHQHLAISVFRAVENRRFLARATNSGVSAIVTPTGEITIESNIFVPALIVSPIALIDELSIYTRLGDWFAWGCVAYSVFGIICACIFSYRNRKNRGA